MNVQGGRCERCQGTGLEKIEMNYLPDSYITCSECMGQRFTEKVLSVKYKGYTISDLLDNPIENIKDVFINEKDIYNVTMLDRYRVRLYYSRTKVYESVRGRSTTYKIS